MDGFPGFQTSQVLGPVFGDCPLTAPDPVQALAYARMNALNALTTQASQIRADAVIGLSVCVVTVGAFYIATASGTAVKLAPAGGEPAT